MKGIADYVSAVKAGDGAMRDFVEYILSKRGDKDQIIKKVISAFWFYNQLDIHMGHSKGKIE